MSRELDQHLRTLGIAGPAAEVYRSLLEHGPRPAAHIAEELDRSASQVRGSFEELGELGLIALDESSGVVHAILDPTAALRSRRAVLELEIAISIDASVAAYERHRRNHAAPSPNVGVEILHGGDIADRVAELERSAVHELRGFDTAPYDASSWENPREIANLQRGVGYRIVYAKSSIETPRFYEQNIVPCINAGEVARCVSRVPTKMFLVDDTVAVVSLAVDRADVRHTAMEVRSEQLLAALTALFELTWQTATPLLQKHDLRCDLRPIETLLLRQLAIGVTDKAAARNLRISSRTVARYVERLMELSGATSRFQLAVYAAKHGWLD